MEIVIKIHDIPQNDHERWVLTHGTPLPKGHGRIIDESKIEVCEWIDVWEEDYPKASTDAPTIIEADGGGEDEDRKSL